MSDTILDPAAPVNPPDADDYFRQSRRPMASLLFTLPLLAVYELGVALQGQQALVNGADVWLRQWLGAVGLASSLALPALVIGVLLAWHHTTAEPWRVRGSVLVGMVVECAALALVLLACVHLQHRVFDVLGIPLVQLPDDAGPRVLFARLVSYFGAGVYEETLFRLLLLPLGTLLLRMCGFTPRTSIIAAVLVTSLAFSVAHHLGPHGEPLEPFRFVFRFGAGAFFCVLFLYRGFGVAVGTHALYDVLAGIL